MTTTCVLPTVTSTCLAVRLVGADSLLRAAIGQVVESAGHRLASGGNAADTVDVVVVVGAADLPDALDSVPRSVPVLVVSDVCPAASWFGDDRPQSWLSWTDSAEQFLQRVLDLGRAESACSAAPPAPRHPRPSLGQREREVLVAFASDVPAARIARELGISTTTVQTYLKRIRQKYDAVGRGASTRSALLIRALQDGYLRTPAVDIRHSGAGVTRTSATRSSGR